MKQTRTDTWIATLQAIALHAVLFALMVYGLRWSQNTQILSAQGEPIEADLVAVSDLSASMQRALRRTAKEEPPTPVAPSEPTPPEPLPEPLPKPLPEPEPEAPPKPKTLPPPEPKPAPVEQEKVQRNADSPKVAKVPREQEEKRKQPPQVDLDAQKKQTEMERQRQQQLAEIRKQREQLARERSLAEQRSQQLADAPSVGGSPGNRGTDTDLAAKYAVALQQAIARQWTRPDTVQLGQRCRISIRQIPGGEVINVDIAPSCAYDALGRRSVEAAVLKASPLPYAGFESVFNRHLELNFVAEDR